MKIRIFKKIRFILEYWLVLTLLMIFKLMPYKVVELFAWSCGMALYLFPPTKKLIIANITTAMPELSMRRIKEIARKSLAHTIMAPLEFAWMTSDPRRVEK